MKDDMLQVLIRFHREVVVPDVQRIVEDAIDRSVGSLRNEMRALFQGLNALFDRLLGSSMRASEKGLTD